MARRRLVNRREVMPEDKLSHRPHAGRSLKFTLCRAVSLFLAADVLLLASRWGAPTRWCYRLLYDDCTALSA